MSTVFVADETALRRRIVIKLLPPHLAGTVNVERFKREIQLAAQLQHPNIVPVLQAGVSDGLPYYTMPFIQGESLREQIARVGRLPVSDTVRILRDVACALSCAHESGVVHRDIKPGNVLVAKHGSLVTDFGVAKALSAATAGSAATADDESLTSAGAALGTPAYMAPEQAAADPTVDHRADLYALGLLGYEMLTGAQVFSPRSPQAMMAAHIVEAPVPVSKLREGVPSRLAGLIMRLLEKRPQNRPDSAEAVISELDRLMTTASEEDRTARSPASQNSRRSMVIIGVAAAALLAVAAGGAWKFRGRPSAVKLSRVIVSEFENRTRDVSYDPGVEMLRDAVVRRLTETRVADVATQSVAKNAAPGGLAMSDLQALAGKNSAETIIAGSIYRTGDSLKLEARIISAKNGDVVRVVGPVNASASNLAAGIDELAERTAGGLAEIADPSPANLGIVTGQAPKYEAYRELISGEVEYQKLEFAQSIEHFKRARELDPRYTFALVRIANAYSNLDDCVRIDSVTALLRNSGELLSQYERHSMDRVLAGCRGDLSAAYVSAKGMLSAARRSDYTAGLLAYDALSLGRPNEALAILRRVDPEDGQVAGGLLYYRVLARSYHRLGRYEEEHRVGTRARAQFSGEMRATMDAIPPHAALGRLAELEQLVDESMTMSERRGTSPLPVMGLALWELAAHGYSRESRALAERAFDWMMTRPAEEANTLQRGGFKFLLLLELGKFREALAMNDSLAAAQSFHWRYRAREGQIRAKMGDRAAAEKNSAELAALRQPYLRGAHTYERAIIAALLGDRSKAVSLLQESQSRGTAIWSAHSDTRFRNLWNYPPFIELMKPKG
jgi:tetratricopeptide (TPR) repeat protein/tRNA A-37 threonylcarbamoyl transferase component Bud32